MGDFGSPTLKPTVCHSLNPIHRVKDPTCNSPTNILFLRGDYLCRQCAISTVELPPTTLSILYIISVQIVCPAERQVVWDPGQPALPLPASECEDAQSCPGKEWALSTMNGLWLITALWGWESRCGWAHACSTRFPMSIGCVLKLDDLPCAPQSRIGSRSCRPVGNSVCRCSLLPQQ